jgi:8-oxo-dGTP pyrophosphatase MutT (NUDIX family)
MKRSCGIILYSIPVGKFLIGHVTNQNICYSIPKGGKEADESYFLAAIREMWEESNVEYDSLKISNIIRLPKRKYKSGKKTLYPYLILTHNRPEDFDLKCNTLVEDRDYYEVDGYKWVTLEEALVKNDDFYLHPTQIETVQYILDNGLNEKYFPSDEEDKYFGFTREKLERIRWMINPIKGLPITYVFNCALNEEIQKNWKPQIGDVIFGPTGNFFVISGKHSLHERFDGDTYFFGGSFYAKNDSNILSELGCSALNKHGIKFEYVDDSEYPEPFNKFEKNGGFGTYSAFYDFRYIPYPHELKKEQLSELFKPYENE